MKCGVYTERGACPERCIWCEKCTCLCAIKGMGVSGAGSAPKEMHLSAPLWVWPSHQNLGTSCHSQRRQGGILRLLTNPCVHEVGDLQGSSHQSSYTRAILA